VLDEFKLNAALAEQSRWGGRIGKILVDMNFVSEDILVKALSKQLSVPMSRLDTIDVPQEILERLDPEFARQNSFCPERHNRDRRVLVVAMSDPINVAAIDEITHRTGLRVEPTLAGERAIAAAISRVYGADAYALSDPAEALILNNQGGLLETQRQPIRNQIDALPLAAPIDESEPGAERMAGPSAELAAEMADALESAQRKQLKAIRAMVDLLVEKGVFSRDEYLARINRR
jgi:hypothetical protein